MMVAPWSPLTCVVLSLSIALGPKLCSMPYPYDANTAVPIPEERIARMHPLSQPARSYDRLFHNNTRLEAATRLLEGRIDGSESVSITPKGDLIMIDKFGFVHRARRTGAKTFRPDESSRLYIGPGRPLGFHAFQTEEGGDGLYVCDSSKGLIEVELDSKKISILSNSVAGHPMNYANDLDVSGNGTIYFSSSTELTVALTPTGHFDTMRSYLLNLFRGDASGRLLAYSPETGVTKELVSGLWFANGVAIGPDESFVAVVETSGYRVMRHWLKGAKQGDTDILIGNLPGSPDGISRSSDGNFWISILIPASPLPKLIAPYPWLRQVLSHAFVNLPLPVKEWGCVMKVSPKGEVLGVLLDKDGTSVSGISATTEHDGALYFGHLGHNFVSMVELLPSDYTAAA